MQTSAIYLRTIIFGINDSLVSTVGLLAGLSVAGTGRSTLILTGIIYAFVEGLSMAAGNFLSEESAAEYLKKTSAETRTTVISAICMFVSFVIAALVPLVPYMLLEPKSAIMPSIVVSIIALFITGAVSAHFSKLPIFWRGARMALLGGAAIIMGVVVGSLVPA